MADKVLHCDVCGIQQVVRGPSDDKVCPFCGAASEDLWFEDESNTQTDID